MNSNYLIIANLISYLISLKLFFLIFKMKYYFPFRYADASCFLFNLFLFLFLSLIYYPEKLLIFLFINLNLFYIFFHLLNMIITSPRSKIIIDLMDLKEKNRSNISVKKYLKKYSYKKMVNNRIRRLKSSKQIVEKNKYFALQNNKSNSLYIISLAVTYIEKI